MAIALPAFAVPQGPVVGKIALVLGTVTAVDQDGDPFEVVRGGDLYAGITFTTGPRAFIRADMLDGTRMTLGRNGTMTIEGFRYDPAVAIGEFRANVRLGGFRYVSGEIGKISSRLRHTTISTPTATIGIRGSRAEGVVKEDGGLILEWQEGQGDVSTTSGQSFQVESPGQTLETDAEGVGEVNDQATTTQSAQVSGAIPSVDEENDAENQTQSGQGEQGDDGEDGDDETDGDDENGDTVDGDAVSTDGTDDGPTQEGDTQADSSLDSQQQPTTPQTPSVQTPASTPSGGGAGQDNASPSTRGPG